MNIKYLLLILNALTVLTECSQINERSIVAIENPIPDSICYFFPTESDLYGTGYSVHTPSDLPAKCTNPSICCNYFMVINKSYPYCDSLISIAKIEAIQIMNDSSNMTCLKDCDFDKRFQLDTNYANASINSIVPDFRKMETLDNSWKDSSTISGLNKDYSLYVIKSGSNLVLNDKWNCNRQWLPQHLQHGYRSGIAISPNNDNLILWCIAW